MLLPVGGAPKTIANVKIRPSVHAPARLSQRWVHR